MCCFIFHVHLQIFSHAFHVCIVCKNTLLCGGNKEYLSIYPIVILLHAKLSIAFESDVVAKSLYISSC